MKEGRSTVYNKHTSPEKMALINKENIQLKEDFLDYLSSIDRSKGTIKNYENDLDIFFTYCLDYLGNKFYVDLTKRDIIKFQKHALEQWKWSSNRIRRVKSVLSSLSNYIENILDDEFENYRGIVRKIESPILQPVREKTIFSKEKLQFLLDYLEEKEQYDKCCMLALCMSNGRRKAELPRMKLSYFTEDNLIYGSLYKTPETITTKGRGSEGKKITVYTLKSTFQKYLNLWLKFRQENNINSEWLIPHKVNGIYIDEQVPITTMDSWAETFSSILGEPFYWHSLRHYFTTFLSESNIPDSVIQDLINWQSADMVRIYCDTSADAKFGKYFGEDGIKRVEQGSISDL